MIRKTKPKDDRSMSPLLAIPARGSIPRRIFRSTYPLSYALGLRPVSANGADYEGFDQDAVESALGTDRFNKLMAQITNVFCCGHRHWPADHPESHKRGCEVHCVYARDLEAFLECSEMLRKEH
jgi:hypothetical protein